MPYWKDSAVQAGRLVKQLQFASGQWATCIDRLHGKRPFEELRLRDKPLALLAKPSAVSLANGLGCCFHVQFCCRHGVLKRSLPDGGHRNRFEFLWNPSAKGPAADMGGV